MLTEWKSESVTEGQTYGLTWVGAKDTYVSKNNFYRTQVSLGSDLWVLMSVSDSVQDYLQT